jgi:mannose-6-phosphate isomerase-like protein (cupin superfamily)
MSFYNFKLNDPSTFSTSDSPDSKSAGRFVHKTFQDFHSKNNLTTPIPSETSSSSNSVDGRGKYSVEGWKGKNIDGESFRFHVPTGSSKPWSPDHYNNEVKELPEEIRAVSITVSLQGIIHTYSPVDIATLHSMGFATSIRLVKLAGQSAWHNHEHTDEVFVLLRGAISVLYRGRSGTEKIARVIGGELLHVPMRMEHCIVAEEGTEVLLLEGNIGVCSSTASVLIIGQSERHLTMI